ncbi:MAG: prepilin-type N-terminal cleavage/methylation domain-containing protein [Desulfuromonadales bacterium]|nr:MAG: prepilin-type N-terminal cleavage/methylation domain-containing protein [Desulfuromonadales bacterium]
MIQRKEGFSLVELIVVMAIFVIVIGISGTAFNSLLSHSARESKSVESQITDIIGLELMRVDVEHAGYGLPWSFPTATFCYAEAASSADTPVTGLNPLNYNDGTICPAASTPPRALVAANNAGFNNSDYLVIKSTSVAKNIASPKWGYVTDAGVKKTWADAADNLQPGERVIVISPSFVTPGDMRLVTSGSNFFANYSSTPGNANHLRNFYPTELNQKFLIYGVNPTTDLRMPFNRADFYIKSPASAVEHSQRCAPNTGVLYKATLSHTDGTLTDELPLLDCVADMQIIFKLDMNADGVTGTTSNANGSSVTSSEGATIATVQAALDSAAQIRQSLKEVEIHVLTHEGGKDRNYSYPNTSITLHSASYGKTFDLSATIGGDWRNYRWKVYTLVMKPKNMGTN